MTTTLVYMTGLRERPVGIRLRARMRLVRFSMWWWTEDLKREFTGRISIGGVRAAVSRKESEYP